MKSAEDIRRNKAERQRRWRANTSGRPLDEDGDEDGPRGKERSGAAVTLHLTKRECAALDMIAAKLYRDNPHDPANGVVGSPVVYPGRPQAMRQLIAEFCARTAIKRPASRKACGEFWRAECAFRKATRDDTDAEPPRPPWR
jgi:hypothetical protein